MTHHYLGKFARTSEDIRTHLMKQTVSAVRVLLIGDHPDLRQSLAAAGFDLDVSSGEMETLSRAASLRPQVVVADFYSEDGNNVTALLAGLRALYPTLPVIVLAAAGSSDTSLKQAVFGFLSWPPDEGKLIALIREAHQLVPLTGAWREPILTRNAVMEELLSQAYQISQGRASLLIGGESGTGKELLARAIHAASPRHTRAFVAVNCSAIPENLFESELFGHCKGAFTGATRDHRGLMRTADGGTLFLDEIGEMPKSFQAKLLRTLQEMRVRPVGATQDEAVDVRVVSATHTHLEKAMTEGLFREDLYYRLNVVSLILPKLSERPEDIPLLAGNFLRNLAMAYGGRVKGFASEAQDALVAYPWPGNVRQLRNVVEHCVALATTPEIPLSLVHKALRNEEGGGFPSLQEAKDRFEQGYLLRLMRVTNGNVARAASLAKRNRTEFYRLLSRHKIEPAAFKLEAR